MIRHAFCAVCGDPAAGLWSPACSEACAVVLDEERVTAGYRYVPVRLEVGVSA